MKPVLIIFGYGPGISDAVAQKFGTNGFSVALVSRNRERLNAGVAALAARGVEAAAFVADAGDPDAVRTAVNEVRARMGHVTAIEWTAYDSSAGDLTTATAEEIRRLFNVATVGLTIAIQAALPDLRRARNAAVLVTNGGLALYDSAIDEAAAARNLMGLSIANAAKHKLVRVLAPKLKSEGIYMGEIVVQSSVRGTSFDHGQATLEASVVAEEFWRLYQTRDRHTVTIA